MGITSRVLVAFVSHNGFTLTIALTTENSSHSVILYETTAQRRGCCPTVTPKRTTTMLRLWKASSFPFSGHEMDAAIG